MSLTTTSQPLSHFRRQSGGLAMLAIDQRETMRTMFAEAGKGVVADSDLVEFKLAALRALTPIASGVLIDQDFAWARAIDERAVAPGCGLIAAVDRFHPRGDEIVGDSEIDARIDFGKLAADGAKALKLLVIWRPDEPSEKRVAMVDDFISRCRAHGIASIIEPVSRKPRNGKGDLDAGIIDAAKELGDRGQDLYKAEVPFRRELNESEVRRRYAQLHRHIASPWVILSSGVSSDDFAKSLDWACREGAQGFLAGRAVWKDCIHSSDVALALRTGAVDRLRRLCEVVDTAV